MTAPKNNFGLNRDLMARFNAPGYSPFTAFKAEQAPLSAKELRAEKVKQAAREAAARQYLRRKATRINRSMPQACVASGESLHRKAIREEIARAA